MFADNNNISFFSTVVVLYVQGIGSKEWREVSTKSFSSVCLFYSMESNQEGEGDFTNKDVNKITHGNRF